MREMEKYFLLKTEQPCAAYQRTVHICYVYRLLKAFPSETDLDP